MQSSNDIENALDSRDDSCPERLRFYRPELDLLRLFAFLSVFTSHIYAFDPARTVVDGILARVGLLGLCLFFFLSAYLITELLLLEKCGQGTIHVRAFYLRRILRIWPLYFTFLIFGFALGHAYPAYKFSVEQLASFVFLFGNVVVAKFGFPVNPVAPLWSISIEEQFYLVWPILAKFSRPVILATISCLLFPAGCIAIYLLSHAKPMPVMQIWCNSFVQFQFFGAGSLLAILLRDRTLSLKPSLRVTIFIIGLAFWLLATEVFHVDAFQSPSPDFKGIIWGYILVAVGCTLIFLATLGLSSRKLPKSLLYLGKISYGLYVFHVSCVGAVYVVGIRNPGYLLSVVRYLAALGMTVVLAALSYRYFEKPFLKLKSRFTFVESR